VRLVLLHALPLDGTVWADTVAAHDDVAIAPTLYPLGETITSWARGVLDEAGADPFVVVGNSVGGSCALEVAALAPDQVAGIVLVGAKANVRPEPDARDEAIALLEADGMTAAWPKYWAPLFGRDADSGTIEAARRIAFAQPVDDVIRGVRVFHDRPDRSGFARSWPRPLVVISGVEDRTPPTTTTAALAASAPRGELHVVDDCGHYVGLEKPRQLDAILRLVLQRVVVPQR
jgi:pimeloyl-ACP methyl ester carboxylesterase